MLIGFGGYQVTQMLLEKARWQLVFSDDFERDELGEDWVPYPSIWIHSDSLSMAKAKGYWSVENGHLVCDHLYNTFIRLDRELPGDVRFEFEAMQRDSLSDGIDAFMHARLEELNKIDDLGYALVYGGGNRNASYMKRLGNHIAHTRQYLPVPGR